MTERESGLAPKPEGAEELAHDLIQAAIWVECQPKRGELNLRDAFAAKIRKAADFIERKGALEYVRSQA